MKYSYLAKTNIEYYRNAYLLTYLKFVNANYLLNLYLNLASKVDFNKEIIFIKVFTRYSRFAQYILSTKQTYIKFKSRRTYMSIFLKD